MSRPQGSPLFGGPTPTPNDSGVLPPLPQILWRSNPFRLTVPGTGGNLAVPFFPSRSLTSAMEIYADNANTSPCTIGNSNVTNEFTNPAGVGGNIYFQLDASRHAYVWTDDPLNEFIDVSMFWSSTDNTNDEDQYLHVTLWTGQRL